MEEPMDEPEQSPESDDDSDAEVTWLNASQYLSKREFQRIRKLRECRAAGQPHAGLTPDDDNLWDALKAEQKHARMLQSLVRKKSRAKEAEITQILRDRTAAEPREKVTTPKAKGRPFASVERKITMDEHAKLINSGVPPEEASRLVREERERILDAYNFYDEYGVERPACLGPRAEGQERRPGWDPRTSGDAILELAIPPAIFDRTGGPEDLEMADAMVDDNAQKDASTSPQ